jgi:hypothetical protein
MLKLIAYFSDFPGPEIVHSLNFEHSQIISLPNGKACRIEVQNPHAIEMLRLPKIFKKGDATKIYTSQNVALRLQTAKEKTVLVPS